MILKQFCLTINAAVLYVSAFLVTTIIHEFGHALAGMYFGSNPVWHHNYVLHLFPDNLTAWQSAAIALAGPILSLLQGILAGLAYLKSKRHTLNVLFLLWFAILGLNNFLGYLMTGFIFQKGDIGKVFQMLDVSLGAQLAVAVVAALLLLLLAYKLTVPFLKFSYRAEQVENAQARVSFLRNILILPWVFGSVVVTLAYLPIQAVASIVYPIMSGFVFIFPWQNARRTGSVPLLGNAKSGKVSVLALVVLLVLLVLFKGVLAGGIAL